MLSFEKKLKKHYFKIVIQFFAALFIFYNTFIFIHAYRFTHFKTGAVANIHSDTIAQYPFHKKVSLIFTGIPLSKPISQPLDSTQFLEHELNGSYPTKFWVSTNKSKLGTIALFHGYHASKDQMLPYAHYFMELGYRVVLMDFIGSGTSSFNQTTLGHLEAKQIEQLYAYFQKKEETNRFFLFGHSMGSAAILHFIQNNPDKKIAGCILQAPFLSIRQAIKNRFEIMQFPSVISADLMVFWGSISVGYNAFGVDNSLFAKNIHCPTLLLWGAKDDRVKAFEVEAIAKANAQNIQLIKYQNTGHNDFLSSKDALLWQKDVAIFLSR